MAPGLDRLGIQVETNLNPKNFTAVRVGDALDYQERRDDEEQPAASYVFEIMSDDGFDNLHSNENASIKLIIHSQFNHALRFVDRKRIGRAKSATKGRHRTSVKLGLMNSAEGFIAEI
jgi:hypothetical protein